MDTQLHTLHEEDMILETTVELQSETEMEVDEESRSSLKTKLAVAISKALGLTCHCQSDLKKLDHLRTTIKQGKRSAKNINKHKKLISLFKDKLHQRQRHLKAVIANYE